MKAIAMQVSLTKLRATDALSAKKDDLQHCVNAAADIRGGPCSEHPSLQSP